MELAEHVEAGVAAMGAQRWAEAVEHLGTVHADPAFQVAQDLLDVRASVASLYAQSLLEIGDPLAADRACRDALRCLRTLGDRAGIDEVRKLQDRIVKALADRREQEQHREEARHIAAAPLAELLADAPDAEARATTLVKKARAHLTSGDAETAADLAIRALDVASAHGLVIWEVFARLVLVEADDLHADGHLTAAVRAAADAGESNLISTIAATARSLGRTLPAEAGPHLHPTDLAEG